MSKGKSTKIFEEFSEILSSELAAMTQEIDHLAEAIHCRADRIRAIAGHHSDELAGGLFPGEDEATGLDIVLPVRLKCPSSKRSAVLRAFERYGVSPELIDWMGENLVIVAMRDGRVLVAVNHLFVESHKVWLIRHGVLRKGQAKHFLGSMRKPIAPIDLTLSTVLACLENDPGKAASLGWAEGEPAGLPPVPATLRNPS